MKHKWETIWTHEEVGERHAPRGIGGQVMDLQRSYLIQRVEQAAKMEAECEQLRAAMSHALERLDASLFTNSEHQQAKDALRAALEAKP